MTLYYTESGGVKEPLNVITNHNDRWTWSCDFCLRTIHPNEHYKRVEFASGGMFWVCKRCFPELEKSIVIEHD